MKKQNLADVEIISPGTFKGTSVIVNGLDLSRFCTGIEFNISGENDIAIVKISLISNLRINGKALPDLINIEDLKNESD